MKKPKDFYKETLQYMEFLEKRLNSKNYKNNVSAEEYQKTKTAYDKAKIRIKLLKPKS